MELDANVWGTLLLGGAVVVGWLAFGRGRSKPAPSAAAAGAGSARKRAEKPEAKERPAKPARAGEGKGKEQPRAPAEKVAASLGVKPAAEGGKAGRSGSKAILWEVPQTDVDDEDITVLRAIPVFDTSAEISVGEVPQPKDGDSEEDRVSRIELRYEEDAEAEEVTAASARILLYAAGDSDKGRVRPRNEDSLLVMPERSLFAVADGMGGHRGGEVASSIAIDTLEDAFARQAFEGSVRSEGEVPRRGRELAAAVHMANECVRSMALADRELSDMGTTLVAARFSPNKQRLYVGHVGDSRCYRLRRGNLRQLTTDHTMASLGMKGPHAKDLYQAVGVSPGLMIDLIVDKPQDEDVYLLCSDGLSKMLNDDRIRDILIEHEDLESALYTLLEQANDSGGNDNITVILVKVLSRTSKKAMESLAKHAASS